MQWKQIKSGELLSLAEPQFDLFLTSDQNLSYQSPPTPKADAALR
jgi:hypothetical protein